MEKEQENLETRETGPVDLRLNWFDLRAGHWPDSKDPPWGLNTFGSLKSQHPEIEEALGAADKELKPGEERLVFAGKVQFPDGRVEEVEIKAACRKYTSGSGADLWIWPKADKYYKKKP
jgi:hypothetical protein